MPGLIRHLVTSVAAPFKSAPAGVKPAPTNPPTLCSPPLQKWDRGGFSIRANRRSPLPINTIPD